MPKSFSHYMKDRFNKDGELKEEYAKLENFDLSMAMRVAREESGLSQSDIENSCGVAQSEISKIERGIGNPKVSTLKRIAKAMGMRLIFRFEPIEKVS